MPHLKNKSGINLNTDILTKVKEWINIKKVISALLSLMMVFSVLFVNGRFAINVFAEEAYYGLFSDEQSDGGFEYDGWKMQTVPQLSSYEIINTDSFRGKKSAHFNFQSGGGYKEVYINMDVPAETVVNIKKYKDYCWTAYLKVSSNFMGSVSLNMVEGGVYTSDGLGKKQVYIHSEGKPSDWTRYDSGNVLYTSSEIETFLADKTTVSVVLSVRGSRGDIWVDDIDFKQVENLQKDETLEDKETFGDYSGNLANSGFENGNWTVTKKTDQIVTLDTANGHNGSNTALKVKLSERKASYSSAINFTTTTVKGVAEELDTTKNYRAAIWVKSSDDFMGSISFQVSQNGAKKWYNYQTELHLIGNNTTADSGYANWAYLYTPNFTVTNHDITVTLIVNGVGTIWFDDARIILDPEADDIISNGGFEGGAWSTWGTDNLDTESVSTDTKEAYVGAKSVRLSVTNALDANVHIVAGWDTTKFDPTKTYVLSFAMKYEGVEKANGIRCAIIQAYSQKNADGTTTTGSGWYRYYGSEQILNTGGGSSDWAEYKFTLPAAVWHEGFTNANLYFYLQDKGTLWLDNVKLTEKTAGLELKEDEVSTDTEPGEVDVASIIQLYTKSSQDDIWYTIDGSNPATSETAYLHKTGTGIMITEDVTVKACVKNEDGSMGNVSEFAYTCSGKILPDDEIWPLSNYSDSVSLDTEIKKVGNNSIKITGGKENKYISTDDIPYLSAFDYKLSFWVKTENLIDKDRVQLDIFLTSPAGGGDEPHPFKNGVRGVTVGNYGESFFRFERTQDWTYYEVDLHSLDNRTSAINIIFRNQKSHGTTWIDGLKLTAVPEVYYPLNIKSSNDILGNIYTQSTDDEFNVQQNFYIQNSAETCETGILSYKLINDYRPEVILSNGEIEVNLAGNNSILQNIDISSAKEYGTYTIEFTMENTQGIVYNAGEVKFSRMIDNTGLMENGGTYLGVCGTVGDNKMADLHNVIGNSMLRFDYDWLDVEKEKGVYTIHPTKDNYINTMIVNNIEPMVIINDHGWPSWMEKRVWPTTEHDVEHFLGYVKFLVETYKGKVKYFEFYNEVDHRHWVYPDVYPDAVGYTELLKKVYKVVKEANPDAILVAGVTSGIGQGWARTMFQNGAADYLDGYSVHPYIQSNSPESADWLADMQGLCDIIKEYSDKYIPLFITEMGWPNTRSTVKGNTYQDTLAYSTRTYTFAKSLDILEKIVTYTMGSGTSIYSSENQYGMMGPNNIALPLTVGRTAFNYMHNGFEFDSAIDFAQGLYTYKFTGETENMYVIWTDDVEDSATITTTCNKAEVYDVFGNRIAINYNGNSFTANVGSHLIYVRVTKGEKIEKITVSSMPQDILDDALLANGSLEEKPDFWTTDSVTCFDTETKYDGYKSLKVNFFEGSTSGTTILLSIPEEKLEKLDSSVNYKLRFFAKSDGNYNGSLIIDPKMYLNSKEFFLCNWTWGTDYPILNTGTIPTEWMQFETPQFPLMGDKVSILLAITNKIALSDAAVWLDHFELVPVEENDTKGTIRVDYDEETGLPVVVVSGKEGYMPTTLTVKGAKGNGQSNYTEIQVLGSYRSAANQMTYAVDFGEYNKYYMGQSFKVFEATYTEIPKENDPTIISGDANGDYTVDLLDLVRFKNYQLGNIKVYEIVFFNVWFDRSDNILGATDFAALRKKIWNSF